MSAYSSHSKSVNSPNSSKLNSPNASSSPNKSKHHQNSQGKTYSYSNSPKGTQSPSPVKPAQKAAPKELLVMTIDLGDGTKDLVRVFEGDEPIALATAFCDSHGLSHEFIEPLAQNIYANMEQVLQESVNTLDLCGISTHTEPLPDRDESPAGNFDTGKFVSLGEVSQPTPELMTQYSQDQIQSHYQKKRPQELSQKERYLNDLAPENKAKSADYNPVNQARFPIQEKKKTRAAPDTIKYDFDNDHEHEHEHEQEDQEHEHQEEHDDEHANEYEYEDEQEMEEYEHPHHQYMMRNPSPITSSMKRNNESRTKSQMSPDMDDVNYGTLLYHRGVKLHQETRRHLEDQKKEREEKAIQECTFTPQLNPKSHKIMSTKKRVAETPDVLIQSGEFTKQKLEKARNDKVVQEMSECTFHPETNIISQRINEEKERMTEGGEADRCLKLYKESKIHQAYRESLSRTLSADYTFRPMTNDYKESSVSQTTFEQRDMKFKERQDKVNNLRRQKEEAEIFDAATGEPLFRPKTGRAPKMGRNNGNLPIGDHLYNQQYKQEYNKKQLSENHEKAFEASKPKSNEKSQTIVENLMIRKLQAIFAKIDSDGDGVISSAKSDISQIEDDVLEILTPLLCEMEENNHTLDFEQFYVQTLNLLKRMTVAEKNILIFGKRNGNAEPEYNFQPQINSKSEKLALKKHPYGNFDELYGSYLNERREVAEKLKEKQEQKAADELKECSFKPKITTNPKGFTVSRDTSTLLMEQLLL